MTAQRVDVLPDVPERPDAACRFTGDHDFVMVEGIDPTKQARVRLCRCLSCGLTDQQVNDLNTLREDIEARLRAENRTVETLMKPKPIDYKAWSFNDEKPGKGEDRRVIGRYKASQGDWSGRAEILIVIPRSERESGLVDWQASTRIGSSSHLVGYGRDDYDTAKRKGMSAVANALGPWS